jgi:HTH-type transcriptional dual regulator CecR, C-terminal domain
LGERLLTNFVKTGAMPFLASATELVRRFLPPGTSDQDAMCAAISLMGQCSAFVRNRAPRLARIELFPWIPVGPSAAARSSPGHITSTNYN